MKHKLIIELIRIRKGMSQDDVAASCGITQGYLSAVENNKKSPTFRVLCKIAEALEVCPKELIRCNCKD